MVRRFFLAALVMASWFAPAAAQVTSEQAVIGYLSTTGCPSGQTVCFVQYGAAGSGGGGGAVTQGTSPWIDDITQWANVALGAPSAYGTAPTSGSIVPGVNAYITNPVAVTGTFFQSVQPVSGTVTNSPATGASLTTSQPSVTATAAALTFAGTAHREIYNPAASTASIFIGASGVTTTTGWEIPPGASSGDLSRFSGTVYAVAATAVTVRLISY